MSQIRIHREASLNAQAIVRPETKWSNKLCRIDATPALRAQTAHKVQAAVLDFECEWGPYELRDRLLSACESGRLRRRAAKAISAQFAHSDPESRRTLSTQLERSLLSVLLLKYRINGGGSDWLRLVDSMPRRKYSEPIGQQLADIVEAGNSGRAFNAFCDDVGTWIKQSGNVRAFYQFEAYRKIMALVARLPRRRVRDRMTDDGFAAHVNLRDDYLGKLTLDALIIFLARFREAMVIGGKFTSDEAWTLKGRRSEFEQMAFECLQDFGFRFSKFWASSVTERAKKLYVSKPANGNLPRSARGTGKNNTRGEHVRRMDLRANEQRNKTASRKMRTVTAILMGDPEPGRREMLRPHTPRPKLISLSDGRGGVVNVTSKKDIEPFVK